MMRTKKYVFAVALAALMLTGAVHAWMISGPTKPYYSTNLAVRNDTTDNDEGSSVLDTKFFLPQRPGSSVAAAAEQERREALLALLTTYEQR